MVGVDLVWRGGNRGWSDGIKSYGKLYGKHAGMVVVGIASCCFSSVFLCTTQDGGLGLELAQ